MKQELMTATNNDELQNKWKNCVQVTCNMFNIYEVLRECAEKLTETFRLLLNSIKDALSESFSKLSEVLKEFNENIQKYCKKEESNISHNYPHSFPHYVDNLKLNTRGFPQPVMRCARSRC